MVLTERLLHAGTRRPHVLLVPVPGYRPVRWAAERYLQSNGWPLAASPAEADVLLVCGAPGTGLAGAIDTAWDAMPGPRARATTRAAQDVPAVLATARGELRDLVAQRTDARVRPAPALGATDAAAGMAPGGTDDHAGMTHEQPADAPHSSDGRPPMQQDQMQHEGMEPGGEHEGMDHGGGHEGHSMHDMGMDLPGGLAMADRADDRDGLKLDVLHLSWGPLLPAWPAGLQLALVLQGDVLQEVVAHWLDPSPELLEDPRRVALDDVAAVLDVAGWQEGAVRARRLRDGGLEATEIQAVTRRVTRARLLRWTLRGLPAPEGRDVVAHLRHLLDVAAGRAEPPRVSTQDLEAALRGLDLGTAAVVVAAYAGSVRERVPAGG